MSAIFPALPNSLQQFLSKPPAISTSEITNQFRSMNSEFPTQTAEMGERLQQFLDSLSASQIATLQFISGASLPNIPSISTLAIPLVAATTVTITAPPPTNEGDQLFVFVMAAGPTGVLAWDPVVFHNAPTQFDSTSLTETRFQFVGTSKALGGTASPIWVLVGLQLTGQT